MSKNKELRERIKNDVDGYIRSLPVMATEPEKRRPREENMSREAVERFQDESYEGLVAMGLHL